MYIYILCPLTFDTQSNVSPYLNQEPPDHWTLISPATMTAEYNNNTEYGAQDIDIQAHSIAWTQ